MSESDIPLHPPGIPPYNRDAAEQVTQSIRDGSYCALLGPRFAGKSNLLRFVQKELEPDLSYACIYVNLRGVGALTQSGFFAGLASIIAQQIESRIGHRSLIPTTDVLNSAGFRGFLEATMVLIQRDFILIIDHLEAVPNDLLQALLTSLRAAYMDQQAHEHRLVAVVSGALSLTTLTVGESSPFRGIARRVFVGNLAERESLDLVTTHTSSDRIKASAAAQASLLRATRGDPYLITLICDRCVQIADEYPSRRLTTVTVKRVVGEFIHDEAADYEPLREAVQLVEEDPDLLRCTLLLLERPSVPRRELHLSLSPDLDPLYLTGLVRTVDGDSYAVRNETYRQFLAQHFDPGHVGHVLTMAGRWDFAIDYLEHSVCEGHEQYRSELLAATINSMYATEDVKHTAYYLGRGLSGAFGIREACVYYLLPHSDTLTPVEQLRSTLEGTPPIPGAISISKDCLEARAYREGHYLRGYGEQDRSVLVVPLSVPGGKPTGVVTIYDYLIGYESTQQRERIMQLLGYLNQAARAVQEVSVREAQMLRIRDQAVQLEEKTNHLSLLHRIGTLVHSMTDLEKMLNLILTGITAHYGLGFNRAWIFLLDRERTYLTGRMAIGDFTYEDACCNWEHAAQVPFDQYAKSLLKAEEIEETPIDRPTRELRIPVADGSDNAFSRAAFKCHAIRLSGASADGSVLPPEFQQRFEPEGVIVAPLLAQGACVGIVVVDDKFSRRIHTNADEEMLMTFANQAAAALVSARQRHEEHRRRELAETLREVSAVIGRSLDLGEVLEQILEQMARVLPFDTTSIQLMNASGTALKIIASKGFDDPASVEALAFPLEGAYPNTRVWHRKMPLRYPDILVRFPHFADPKYHATQVRDWLGAPLLVGDRAIGVITLDSFTPDLYTPEHERLAALFAGQAAMAIQNASHYHDAQRRIRDLEIVNGIAQIMGTKLDTPDLLQAIVSQVTEQLHCTHCTLFFPQKENGELLLVPRVTHGLREEQVMTRSFKPDEGLAGWVFQHGESLVFADARQDSRFAPARQNQNRPRSMLVAPVKVGDQTVGVISADQDKFGWFSESDRRLVDALAQHAGIAIERAIALELLHDISKQITSPQKVDDILRQIVSGAIKLTNTTAGVIYLINEDGRSIAKTLQHPADFDPLRPRIDCEQVLVHQVLKTGEILVIPDTRQDDRVNLDLDCGTVRSMIAIPLKLKQEVIGILYLNDVNPHAFTETEVSLLSTLAAQAAIAIVNARLLENTSEALEKRVAELETLQDINEAITSTFEFDRILEMILDRALGLTGAHFGTVQLVENEQELVWVTARGATLVKIGERLRFGEGVTGRSAQDGRSYRISDLQSPEWEHLHCAYIPGMRSALAVPMHFEGQVIGVINIESADTDAFDEDDERLLEGLTRQAAIAIRNAKLYEAIRRRSHHWQALCEASKAIAAGFAEEKKLVLNCIAEQAAERITGIEGPKATWGAILLYDEATNELRFESVHPCQVLSEPEVRLRKGWPLDRGGSPDSRIGITGRTILEKKPQRVKNVRTDTDYVEFNPQTRSELDVPLLDGDRVIGVLSVESDKQGAFDEEDEHGLQGLAELAVIAIKNAERAEQLSRTNAVALMGAWGADVAHDVNREVGAIRRTTFLLQQLVDIPPEVKKRLQDIDRYASRLALPELPERTPESGRALEFRDAPFLDTIVHAEVQELEQAHPHVTFRVEHHCTGVRVAIDSRWLRRLMRHLTQNAVNAVPPDGQIGLVTIRTSVQGPIAEVQVEDTGKGVRPEIRTMLFQQPIPHKDGRLGRGLLLVRFLTEQHGGYAKLVWSEQGQGACFAFGLPLAHPTVGAAC